MPDESVQPEPSFLKRYLRSGKHWPIMLVVLFVTQASIVLATAVVASGRGSRPIDEGYYARSLDWDNEHAARRKADELGWRITPSVGTPSGTPSTRPTTMTLTDAEGKPIDGALVQVEMFHRARYDEKISAVLPEVGDGVYTKPLAVGRNGLWEMRVHIRARGEEAMVTELVEVEG